MVPIFKGKGDVMECNNYRGIKLMSHTMKLWERMIEARGQDYKEKHKTRLKTNVKRTVLNNTKLRHF